MTLLSKVQWAQQQCRHAQHTTAVKAMQVFVWILQYGEHAQHTGAFCYARLSTESNPGTGNAGTVGMQYKQG